MNKAGIAACVDNNSAVLIDIADKIWEYAETAFEEYASVKLLVDVLKKYGFEVEEGIGAIETAFSASFGSGGPVVGLLAEYDALSGMSQKAGVAEQQPETQGASGHGCGHNLFAAGVVGAAIALKSYMEANKLEGTIKLFGCPGEEGGSGKAFMAREGVFDGLDIALTWHPFNINSVFDASTLANYQVLYKFRGLAAHAAASPHLGRSALDAVELMNVGVQFLREHILQEARIHYAITNSGGFSPNVVQPSADVLYLMRAPKTQQVEEIFQRVNNIARGAALMTDTDMEIQFVKACANIVPNKTLSRLIYDNFCDIGVPVHTDEEREQAGKMRATRTAVPEFTPYTHAPQAKWREYSASLKDLVLCDSLAPFYEDGPEMLFAASSDVGDVSWNVPTAQVVTASFAIGTPEHSWQLVAQGRSSYAHKGMLAAAKVMAATAADVLLDPSIAQKAWKELQSRLDGHKYHCAIPANVKPTPLSKL